MKRTIRQSLIDSTWVFVTDMLVNAMKQSADPEMISRMTDRMLKALPSSVRFATEQ